MTDVISNPSLRLRVLATLARWALWLLASAWITLGLVWGGLHFVIVPRIGEFRPWVEQQATRTLGITVRIGDITAQSNGLIPSVALRDVRLLDPLGREALHLPSVLAALSPRSALSLRFEQLYIDRPELEIRRTADGRIWVAGFALPEVETTDTDTMDWLFSQPELAVRHGKVRWTDERRNVPTLQLEDVDLVLRNRHRTHALRVDANPPAGWGQRLTFMGDFKQPLLSRQDGNWREWTGQLFASATQVNLGEMRNYVNLGVDLSQGRGALRAWVALDRAQIVSATADVALTDVTAKVGPKLAPLDFAWMSGRLGAERHEDGFEYSTQGLAFDTRDGLRWPGGNVRLRLQDAIAAIDGVTPAKPQRGTFTADRLDLAALAEIAQRMPFSDAMRAQLVALAPRGLVETLEATWQGPSDAPELFTAKGRISGLAVVANPDAKPPTPGIRAADIDFALDQNQGRANISINHGGLDLPGVLESPSIALDQLGAEMLWKREPGALELEFPKLRFSNADGQGEAQLKWHSTAAAGGTAAEDWGFLEMQGSLSRLDGAALHRYLPLAMNAFGRNYLRDSLLGGTGTNVRFKVRGDLNQFPFENTKQGDFRVSATVQNAGFAYAPARVLPKDSLPWPNLTQVSGELLLEQDTLTFKGAKGMLAGSSTTQITKGEATLTKLYGDIVVAVNAEARGPLSEALAVVNSSPVGDWIDRVLASAVVSGNADYRIKLSVPVENLAKSTVQGSVILAGNELQISPLYPRLSRARGVIAFNENGFNITGGQARALGGDLRIEGGLGLVPQRGGAPATLRFTGVASAEGLRQTKELGPLARLGQYATGSAPYSLTVGLRAGVPELLLTSPLTGMGLSLPAPLGKAADIALQLRLETALVRSSMLPGARLQEQMQLDLGRLASVTYVRDISGPEAKVLRGAVAVGLASDESAPLPAEGVVANLNINQLDVDAWIHVLSQLSGEAVSGTLGAAAQAYLPTNLAVRAKALVLDGRKLNNVVVGGSRDGLVWRANLDANELNGYVEYRQPSGPTQGRLYARLARLVIGPATAQDVENLLDLQPASIPALDIVVEDFELRGKKLGRIDVQATNLGVGNARDPSREWRLNRFNISTPEATLTATGNWANINAQAAVRPAQNARERRRTVLNFKLDVSDSGDLLERFGMPGVIAKGKGKVEGQVAWLGSPLTLDYPSLGGGFNINMESGQFLKADPGIAKLLGVLSLQSLPRRLTLDFRDVFSEGFSFDFVRGDVTIAQGMARTNNLQMKGVNAAVLMEGQADIARETQQIKVVVIPEINAGSASLIASTINPLVGLTTFLAQVILRGPLIAANTQEFLIDGTWLDPRVTSVERKPQATPPSTQGSSP